MFLISGQEWFGRGLNVVEPPVTSSSKLEHIWGVRRFSRMQDCQLHPFFRQWCTSVQHRPFLFDCFLCFVFLSFLLAGLYVNRLSWHRQSQLLTLKPTGVGFVIVSQSQVHCLSHVSLEAFWKIAMWIRCCPEFWIIYPAYLIKC